MEKKTNYGKIIFITLAVIAAFAAIAYIVYRLFVKNLAKCYSEDECDDFFLEEDDNCECECIQCDALADAE
jgi:hypothetical protein